MELGIDVGNVLERDRLVEQHLVKREREAAVEVVPVEHGQPDDAPNEMEVGQVLLRDMQKMCEMRVLQSKRAKNGRG